MDQISTKKNSPISIGNRIKSARMLSGHSRTSFSKISNISAATLRAWEDPTEGRYGLTEKGAERLINALSHCDINCSKEWLLFGTGYGPALTRHGIQPRDFDFEPVSWDDEESILKDIVAFKSNNRNAMITMILDDAMSPYFSKNNYVGGCLVSGLDLNQLIGTNCIVDTGTDILVGKITACHKNQYTVTSINPLFSEPIIRFVQIKSAAEIIWHRWRKTS